MELQLSFLLGLLIGVFPLFTYAFSGSRGQRKSIGKVFPNSITKSRTRDSNKVPEPDLKLKAPRRMKSNSDLPGLEKNGIDLQSVSPTLITLQPKAPDTQARWEKLNSPVQKNKISPPKKKILTKEELENVWKANHDLLKKSLPPKLTKPRVDEKSQTEPKKEKNHLKEKTNPSKPRNGLKEKTKASTAKGTLTDFQTIFDEGFTIPKTKQSNRFKRRFHAIRRRPSRPSYRRRRPPPRRRKNWNPPQTVERPPPIPAAVDDTDFLSPCFHSNVKRSANPKRRKRASHLHLHPRAGEDDEEDEDYDDEDMPSKVLNNLLSRDINDDMGDEENDSDNELHLNFNKLHNLKSSANQLHHADLSTPRPADYDDFLRKSPHDRKSLGEKRKQTQKDLPKGGSSSGRKLSPTVVKDLANKLKQIERNMKEKEEKESEKEEDPSDPFMSHPHRITSMDIRLLQKSLKNGHTNQWVERELRLIENESKALKLKAKKLHNKLMRFHDQHKSAKLYDADQQYKPGYELPYVYQNYYNDLPRDYDGFRGQNQYVPQDVRRRTHGLMMDHPRSPLNAMEGDHLRNDAMAMGRGRNYPTGVYSTMDQNHPRNIGHVLSKLQYDVADVKAMLDRRRQHGQPSEEKHSGHGYHVPYSQLRGYESGGRHRYDTGSRQSYESGGPHGLETGDNHDYASGGHHDYETGGRRGFDSRDEGGYKPGGLDDYHTGDGQGYDTGGRHGYDTGDHQGYEDAGYPNLHHEGPLGQYRRRRDGYDYQRFENPRTDFTTSNHRNFPNQGYYKQGYDTGVPGDGRNPYERYGPEDGHVNANIHGNHNQGYRYGNNVPGRTKYPRDHVEISRGHGKEGFQGYHDQRYPYRHEPDIHLSNYPKRPHAHHDRFAPHASDNLHDHQNQRYLSRSGYDMATLRDRKYPQGYHDRVSGYASDRPPDYHAQRLPHGHEPGYLGQRKSSQRLHNLEHSKPRPLHDTGYFKHQKKDEAHLEEPRTLEDARTRRMHSMIHDLSELNKLNKVDDYDREYESVEPVKSHDYDYDHGEASQKAVVAPRMPGHLLKRRKRSLETPRDGGSRQNDANTQTVKGFTDNDDKAVPAMQLDIEMKKKATPRAGGDKLASEISLLENFIDPMKYSVEKLRDGAHSSGDRTGVGFQEKKLVDLHNNPNKRTWKARQWFKSRSDTLKKSSPDQPNIKHHPIHDLNHKGTADKMDNQFKRLLNLFSAQNSPANALNPKNKERENDFQVFEKNHLKVFPQVKEDGSQHSQETERVHEDHMKENIRIKYPKLSDIASSTTTPPEDFRVTEMKDKNPPNYNTGNVHESSSRRKKIFNKNRHHQFLTAPVVNIRYRGLKPMWHGKGPADDEHYWELTRSSAQKEAAHHPRQYLKNKRKNKEIFGKWAHRGKPNWLVDRFGHLDDVRHSSFVRNKKKMILHKSASDPPVYQLERLKVSPNTEIKWLKIVSRKPIKKPHKQYATWSLMHPRFENPDTFLADYFKKPQEPESGSRTDPLGPKEILSYNLKSKNREPNDDFMPWVFNRQNFNLLPDDAFANLAEAIAQYSDKRPSSRSKRESRNMFFKREPVTAKELDMKKELVELLRRFPLSDEERKLNEKLKKEDMKSSHASDVGQKILELDKEDDQPFIDMEDAGDLLSGKGRIRRNAGSGKFSRAFDPKPLTSKHERTRRKSIPEKSPIVNVKGNEIFEAETEIKRQRKRSKVQHDRQFHDDVKRDLQKRHHSNFKMPESDKHEHEIRKLKELLKSNMKLINSAADKFLNHDTRDGSFEPYFVTYPLSRIAMAGNRLSHRKKASHSRDGRFRDTPTEEAVEETIKDRMRSNREEDLAYDEDRDDRINEDTDNQGGEVDYRHDDDDERDEKNDVDDDDDNEGREDYEDDDERRELDNEEDDRSYDESENTDTERHSRRYRSTRGKASLGDTQKDNRHHVKPTAQRLRRRRSIGEAPEDDEEDYLGDKEVDDIANKKGQGYAGDKEKIDYDEADESNGDEDEDSDDDDEEDDDEEADEKDESEKEEGITVQDKGHLSEPKDDFAYVEKDIESKNKEQYSWSGWSECSVSCGIGRRFRSNICADGEPCSGKSASTEVEVCSDREEC